MISFRTKQDAAASIVLIISFAAILATALYMALVPPPSAAGLARTKGFAVNKLEKEIDELKNKIASDGSTLASQVRMGTGEQISPQILAEVTRLAKDRGLKVNGFRPQRTVEVGELTQLPFVFTLEGRYTAVLEMIRQLESPATRLTVGMVQLSSMDGASDTVTGTVTVSVYAPTGDLPLPGSTTNSPTAQNESPEQEKQQA